MNKRKLENEDLPNKEVVEIIKKCFKKTQNSIKGNTLN